MSQRGFFLYLGMFVRKKKNTSGKICVQVIDKSSGKYKVVYTVGSSDKEDTINQFVIEAKKWIKERTGALELDFSNETNVIYRVLEGVEHLRLSGIDLLLGGIFNEIGFGKVDDPIFKYLVLYRLTYPNSKLKTTEFLNRYHQIQWSEDQVYRYLDKLHSTQKGLVQQISYDHTQKILNNEISVVFYDVTTLYFEIDYEDALRKTGFSKEGKHQNPQIVLGLLVSRNGYPLAYDIFEGNKFEGRTMLPVIDAFKEKYSLDQLVIIADSGLLSNDNIEALQTKGYEFILGARIKNESASIKKEILNLSLKNGQSTMIKKGALNLIITYSEQRAKKDSYNRKKGLSKLEKRIRTGKLTKSSINNRGYNKYLKLEGELKVIIDTEKFEQDAKWDGLKGYITNSKLDKDHIIENYKHLWQIEKAFRVTKSALKIRPIYHRLQHRIEAHICISFVAYKVYKELERQLYLKKAGISPQNAIDIAKSIFEIIIKASKTKTSVRKLLLITEEQKKLANIFQF